MLVHRTNVVAAMEAKGVEAAACRKMRYRRKRAPAPMQQALETAALGAELHWIFGEIR
jgi:hypothetical protein